MNKEEIYTFNNFVISYDKNIKDRSYLLISKIAKTNIYILGELYDEGADIVNTIINELQQENKQLKIQVSAREEVANKYKKVIDETRHYVEKECNDLLIGYFHNRFDTTEYYEKLLQILDKGESNE